MPADMTILECFMLAVMLVGVLCVVCLAFAAPPRESFRKTLSPLDAERNLRPWVRMAFAAVIAATVGIALLRERPPPPSQAQLYSGQLPAFAGVHYVRGYFRSDGTYVRGHYRSNPDHTTLNNLNGPYGSSYRRMINDR